jgi:hypothetical protein
MDQDHTMHPHVIKTHSHVVRAAGSPNPHTLCVHTAHSNHQIENSSCRGRCSKNPPFCPALTWCKERVGDTHGSERNDHVGAPVSHRHTTVQFFSFRPYPIFPFTVYFSMFHLSPLCRSSPLVDHRPTSSDTSPDPSRRLRTNQKLFRPHSHASYTPIFRLFSPFSTFGPR